MPKAPKTEEKKDMGVELQEDLIKGFDILSHIIISRYIDKFIDTSKESGKLNISDFKPTMQMALKELHIECDKAFDRQILAINADMKRKMDLMTDIPSASALKV